MEYFCMVPISDLPSIPIGLSGQLLGLYILLGAFYLFPVTEWHILQNA